MLCQIILNISQSWFCDPSCGENNDSKPYHIVTAAIAVSDLPTGESFCVAQSGCRQLYDLHNKLQFRTLSTGILMAFTVIVSRCLVVALSGKKSGCALLSCENTSFPLTLSRGGGFVLYSSTVDMTSFMLSHEVSDSF